MNNRSEKDIDNALPKYPNDEKYANHFIKAFFISIFIITVSIFAITNNSANEICVSNRNLYFYFWPFNQLLNNSLSGSKFSEIEICRFFATRAITSIVCFIWLIYSMIVKITTRNNIFNPQFIILSMVFSSAFFIISSLGFNRFGTHSLSLSLGMTSNIIKSTFFIVTFYAWTFFSIYSVISWFIGIRIPWKYISRKIEEEKRRRKH